MCFVLALKTRFFTSFTTLWLLHRITMGPWVSTLNSWSNDHNWMTSFVASISAWYLVSIVESVIVSCSLPFQRIEHPWNLNNNLVVDFHWSKSWVQSTFAKSTCAFHVFEKIFHLILCPLDISQIFFCYLSVQILWFWRKHVHVVDRKC